MSFIIDPNSVSFEQIRTDLRDWLDTQPDSAKWRDFFSVGTGQTLIDLVSGLAAFIQFNIITARRESFIQYAKNRSSVIAAAETLGYSAFRGRNIILELITTPNLSGLIPKFTIMGSIKDFDLILLEDTIVNSGVQSTMKVLVGLIKEETKIAQTQDPSSFRFTQKNVSQDVRLFKNSVEVEISERVLDMINEKFAIQSNVLGSVDALYLNLTSFVDRYNVGDEIKLQWVELSNSEFSASDVIFDFGTLVSYVTFSLFQDPETTDSIRVNAPLFAETQFIIRGRDDYMKTFKLLNTNINDTKYVDISPAVVELCYVQKEICLFTDVQLNNFITQLSSFRPMGLEPPTIAHPTIIFLDLSVTMSVLNASGDPTTEVETIMSSLEKVLKQSIDFSQLEHDIETLPFVKVARIVRVPTDWEASTFYSFGKHVNAVPSNDFIYKMTDLVYKSGATQPVWPGKVWSALITYPLGSVVYHGTLYYESMTSNINLAPNLNPLDWFVTSIPAGNSISDLDGILIEDGRIVWRCIDASKLLVPPTTWQANTRYLRGEAVVPSPALALPNPPLLDITAAFIMAGSINRSGEDGPATAATASYVLGNLVATAFYDGVDYYADSGGTAGNSISLIFNGLDTVQQVVNAWNVLNPTNTVIFDPPAASTTISPAATKSLHGGSAAGDVAFPAAGTHGGVNFYASYGGSIGNLISLSFNGIDTAAQVVNNWNLANSENPVVNPTSPDDISVPPVGVLALTGGSTGVGTLDLESLVPGANANLIVLNFNGKQKLSTVVSSHNASFPTNTIKMNNNAAHYSILPAAGSIGFSGGLDSVLGEPIWPNSVLPLC